MEEDISTGPDKQLGRNARDNKPRHRSSRADRPSGPHYYAGYPSMTPPAYGPGYPSYATYGGMDRHGSDGDMIDVATLLRSLWRKKTTILLLLCFALLTAYYYLAITVPIYRAESLIELSLRRPRILGQQDAVIDDVGRLSTLEMYNTQLAKLRGKELRKQVLDKILPQAKKMGLSEDELLAQLTENVDIKLVRSSSLVKITAMSSNTNLAALMANSYAATAVERAVEINRESSQSAVEWLEAQRDAQRKEFDKAESRRLEFRKENPIDTLEDERETVRTALTALKSELTSALAARDALLARYTPKHPEVVAQEQNIRSAQTKFDNELARAEKLERLLAERKSRLDTLDREKSVIEFSFKGILNRIEEARLSADENTATVKIVEQASVPNRPVYPRRILVYFLATAAGLLGGSVLAALSHRLEDRILSPVDVEKDLGLRIIGWVPRFKSGRRKELALHSLHDKFSLIAEAFGSIRGILDAATDCRTFLLTSTMPEEGKTICSSNLAIVSARSGVKTLLIDFDMRRPRLGRIWRISDPDWSLLHTLFDTRKHDFSSLPKQTAIPNLHIVISHAARDISPAEVLGSQRARDFLKWAAENYDRVIVDSPPVGVASDAMVLGSMVDKVIVVGRFAKTKKSLARGAIRRLVDMGADVLGFVVNDVRFSRNYLSHYDTFESYGHHYGYAATYHAASDKDEVTGA